MAAHEAAAGRWELTDEEWCELCFMSIHVEKAREQLEQVLLSGERPTLHELWVAMSAYRDMSDEMLEYMASRLRIKAGIEHRNRSAV
jgi:hypothetical protein